MNLNITKLKEQQGEDFVAFFLSDLHLSKQNLEHIHKLETFVEEVISLNKAVKIFFVGDVFDLWVGKASPVKKQVQALLHKLKTLQVLGGEVYFFEGNHDLHLETYFGKKWGFKVVNEFWQGDLAGMKVRLEHGDLFDPADTNYLFLRRFLRKWWVKFLLLNVIPSFIINLLGDYFSKQSSKSSKNAQTINAEKQTAVEDKLKAYALNRLEAEDLDLFVCGHTHLRNVYDIRPGKVLVNLGTWQGHDPVALALTKDEKLNWIEI